MEQSGLPIYSGPVDTLRQGLNSLESAHASKHPLHSLQSSKNNVAWASKLDTVRRMYGSHMAMTLATEREIFSRMRRLPGLETSNVGLETVMGVGESIDFPDFLNVPVNRPETPKFQVHSQMEVKLGIL
ncbi:proteasome maturation factor UMP1 [Ochromonadaceae sp. CCMP2298]|nr:proteasome maturation factor UMP1 [Ochromonadaceae sp. CCMP2298]|eukprot:CAMPEP_0173193992 /NCGR_PEP_ID=MMETSP1141-20130122/14263_1 /TAXON_ID=483371 /ORGANISM="non described non described, Strain CCMP2298" /LENGTH=128 /DNA_ID=CAMNT_0014118383 /DNA_START=34 /DNA_END=420 /DNA_ORIENTATION=+